MSKPRASIFTVEQERELKRLKLYFPYRIVWGEIVPDTQQFTAYASYTRRQLMASLRKGNLVATIGSEMSSDPFAVNPIK